MANRKTHIDISIITTIVESILENSDYSGNIDIKKSIEGILLKMPWAFFGTILPDIIEKPISPNHRGFFHSIGFVGILLLLHEAINNGNLDQKSKMIILTIIQNYLKHLGVDLITPKSLPLI